MREPTEPITRIRGKRGSYYSHAEGGPAWKRNSVSRSTDAPLPPEQPIKSDGGYLRHHQTESVSIVRVWRPH
jgi:hypothetical protein